MSSIIPEFARECGITAEQAVKLLEMKHTDPLRFWDVFSRLIGKIHHKQDFAKRSSKSIKLILGGNRSGKTEVGAYITAMYAQNKYFYYDEKGERCRRELGPVPEIWVVSLSGDTQDSAAQPTLMKYFAEEDLIDVQYAKGTRLKSFVVKSTGTKVVFKTCDQQRRRLQGAGLRLVWMDEEPPEDVYEEISMRVAGGIPLDIIITMTPTEGISWTYHQLYKSEDQSNLEIIKMGTKDNPWLTEDDLEQLKYRLTMRGLSDREIAMRMEGDYIQMKDLVCDWFTPNKNYMDIARMPLDRCTHYRVFDFGFNPDPSVALFAAVDAKRNVYIYDGINETNLEHEAFGREVLARSGDYRYTNSWGDSASPEAIQTFKRLGIYTKPVKKVRVKGTSGKGADSWHSTLAQCMRKYGRVQETTGEPKLYFAKHLTRYDENSGREVHWIGQQLDQLRWGVKGIKGEEEATGKWDDTRKYGHHFDAVYALAYFLYMLDYKEGDIEKVRSRMKPAPWGDFRLYQDSVI